MELSVVVEGAGDVPIARRLAADAGFSTFREHVCHGKPKLDALLGKYLQAAAQRPYLILRDLDEDAACAPDWLGTRRASRWCALRLAVRSAESWLLADRARIAAFLGVAESLVPREPDGLSNPKKELVALSRRSSRRVIREGICPAQGHVVGVGPDYTTLLHEFVTKHWRPTVAEKSSPSLRRARESVRDLARRWRSASGED